MTSTANHILRSNGNHHPWRYLHEMINVFHVLILYLCMVVIPKKVFRSDYSVFFVPLSWVKTEFEFLEKILWMFQVSSKVLNIDMDVTEFSLIDLSSALRTVTSDSFVVENYQVPFLRLKMRLKKTLIKVAYKPSITRKNYNNQLLCRKYRMSRKDVHLLDSTNIL